MRDAERDCLEEEKSIISAMRREHTVTVERMARCDTISARRAPLTIESDAQHSLVRGWFPRSRQLSYALWEVWKNLRLMVRIDAEQDYDGTNPSEEEEADSLFETASLCVDMTSVLFAVPIRIQKSYMSESIRRCKINLLQPMFLALRQLFPLIVTNSVVAWLVLLDERFHELVFTIVAKQKRSRRKGLAQFYELFDDLLQSRRLSIDLLLPLYCPTGNGLTAHPFLQNRQCCVELSRKPYVTSVFAVTGICVDWYAADKSGCFFEQDRLEVAGLHRPGFYAPDVTTFHPWFALCIPQWWSLVCNPVAPEVSVSFNYEHQAVECLMIVVEGDEFEEFEIKLYDGNTMLSSTRIKETASHVATLGVNKHLCLGQNNIPNNERH